MNSGSLPPPPATLPPPATMAPPPENFSGGVFRQGGVRLGWQPPPWVAVGGSHRHKWVFVDCGFTTVRVRLGTDIEEKDEKRSQNNKTGLGMEKQEKTKSKSKPKPEKVNPSQPRQIQKSTCEEI
ncbi:hypothetical protein Tco_1012055 [Tanacetum coccineum]